MSEECNHDCSACGEAGCGERVQQELVSKLNPLSNIKHVIGVVSGKGGVGKSLVTSLLAVSTARHGYHTGILDADITGPSIPKIFGVKGEVRATSAGAYPVKTSGGIDIVSINLFLEHDTDKIIAELIQIHENNNTLKPYKIRGFKVFLHCGEVA